MLLSPAIAGLLGGNVLAALASEDVFGNLDESREQIHSFTLLANATKVIVLHSYFHLRVLLAKHCPALPSGANPPVAGPH